MGESCYVKKTHPVKNDYISTHVYYNCLVLLVFVCLFICFLNSFLLTKTEKATDKGKTAISCPGLALIAIGSLARKQSPSLKVPDKGGLKSLGRSSHTFPKTAQWSPLWPQILCKSVNPKCMHVYIYIYIYISFNNNVKYILPGKIVSAKEARLTYK